MAFVTRDDPVQDRAAAHLGCPGHHGLEGGEHDPCSRRDVPAEAGVAEAWRDHVDDDACALDGTLRCELARRELFDQLREGVSNSFIRESGKILHRVT